MAGACSNPRWLASSRLHLLVLRAHLDRVVVDFVAPNSTRYRGAPYVSELTNWSRRAEIIGNSMKPDFHHSRRTTATARCPRPPLVVAHLEICPAQYIVRLNGDPESGARLGLNRFVTGIVQIENSIAVIVNRRAGNL